MPLGAVHTGDAPAVVANEVERFNLRIRFQPPLTGPLTPDRVSLVPLTGPAPFLSPLFPTRMPPIKVALADDHTLFRKGIVSLISAFPGYQVILEVPNGSELTKHLSASFYPDIVLLDITMPGMDGYQTASWLKEHYPQVKVLALSMYEDEEAIIKMLKLGARGYIPKDAEPEELQDALSCVMNKGFYHSDLVHNALLSTIGGGKEERGEPHEELSKREMEFLQYVCTELTYKVIATRMGVALSTVDGYREALFEKLKVTCRTGLVIYAIKNEIVKLD